MSSCLLRGTGARLHRCGDASLPSCERRSPLGRQLTGQRTISAPRLPAWPLSAPTAGLSSAGRRGGAIAVSAAPAAAAAVVAAAAPVVPLIAEGWPLWCLILSCAAVGQLMDSYTRAGALLGGPLVSMLCAIALSGWNVIPLDTPAYDVVWVYLMPLAAACFLLESDMAQLLSSGGQLLTSFLVGAFGMMAGAMAGWALLKTYMGPEAGCIAASLCASYIGGSINFVAVSNALGLSAAVIPAVIAADNIGMAAFLAVLMAVPKEDNAADEQTSGKKPQEQQQPTVAEPLNMNSISLSLACGGIACALSQKAAAALNMMPFKLLFMSLIAIALSSTVRLLLSKATALVQVQSTPATSPFAGASQIGSALMLVFFAIIGANTGGLSQLGACWPILAFLTIMVLVHWLVLFTAGSLLRLPRVAMLLGSNTCIGGPATSAGMAMSKGWYNMAQTSMLIGSLGYAVGTLSGLMVAKMSGAA